MKTEVKEESNPKKQKIKIIIIICTVLSFVLIGIGIYIYYSSTPKAVTSKVLDVLSNTLETYVSRNKDLNIGDNYTLDSTIKFNLAKDLDTTTQEGQLEQKTLNNLNKTINKVKIVQDTKNKELLATLNTKLNNQELINAKYLITNSTEYYFVKNYLQTYVNNGTNNYFENINSNTTTRENYEYLYTFTINSIKNNLKDDYFTTSSEETNINNQMKRLNKISLVLDDKKIKEIASNVLKDLKHDKKANSILTNMNEDFAKSKITSNNNILSRNETITLNMYTNIFYKIEKYELINKNNNDEQKLSYEIINNNGSGIIMSNGEAKYCFTTTKAADKYEIIINNGVNNKKLGTIVLDKSSKRTSISINIKLEETSIDLNFDEKISDIKKNVSYKSNIIIKAKIVSNNVNLFNGTITLNNEMTNKAEIKEDISNSVMASSISEEQKNTNQTNYINSLLLNLRS